MTPTDVASSRSDPKTAMYTEADQHIGKIPSEPDGLQSDDGTTDNGSHPDVTEQRIDDKCREGTSADQSGDNNPTKKLTTLADLIHVCRDRGLQVFNDKPNRPEADKLWLKARTGVILGHRPADRTPSPPTRGRRNGHQSVSSGHTRPTRSRHSKHSRRSKKSNKREEKSRTSYADSFSTGRHDYGTERSYNDSDSNSIHRKTSTLRSVRRHAHASSSGHRSSAILRHDTLTVGSTRYRMSATSRHETLTRSSVLSILVRDFYLTPLFSASLSS